MPILRIAIAIIWRDNRVLIARRRSDAAHGAGFWEFPGGKCDDGESFAACALREVKEETDLAVLLGAPYSLIEWQNGQRALQIQPFDATISHGQERAIESEELRWLRPDELRAEEFPPANVALIAEIQARYGR